VYCGCENYLSGWNVFLWNKIKIYIFKKKTSHEDTNAKFLKRFELAAFQIVVNLRYVDFTVFDSNKSKNHSIVQPMKKTSK
jgi:hypothetical protein